LANLSAKDSEELLLKIENECRAQGCSLERPEVKSVIDALRAQVTETNRLNVQYAVLKNPLSAAAPTSANPAQEAVQTSLSNPPVYAEPGNS
ncbi:MAG: hypothetical protein WCW01_02180, partial [Gammaproteobacteria bacterium]